MILHGVLRRRLLSLPHINWVVESTSLNMRAGPRSVGDILGAIAAEPWPLPVLHTQNVASSCPQTFLDLHNMTPMRQNSCWICNNQAFPRRLDYAS